ncbi:MAG: glycoside hydrolase family 9 protein [Chitinispirillaceae bacterium]
MNQRTILATLVSILFLFMHSLAGADSYRLNQLGYYPTAPKIAIVVGTADSTFEVINSSDEVVFSGELSEPLVWSSAGETVKQAVFTDITRQGTYWIRTESLGMSYPFRISSRAYARAAQASLRSFYFQRASCELEEEHAGVYARPGGHPDTSVVYHPSSGRDSGTTSSPGGWYDAGDFGKYIVNAGITVGTLLQFYEMFGEYFGDSSMNLPESGNGRDDLLDEVRYELEWMKTMQDTDGGVYHKLTTLRFDGVKMPHEATSTRYIIGKATPATLDFAAVMAMAARIYEPIDSGFAASCLSQAEDAWQWAEENPDSFFVNPGSVNGLPSVGTGEYGDNASNDERIWASTELFITTGKEEYARVVSNQILRYRIVPSWGEVRSLASISLMATENDLDETSLETVKNSITGFADNFLEDMGTHPYRIPKFPFNWGSNSMIANQAICLLTAFKTSQDDKYLYGAVECADYLLGKNATGYSFLTGYGINASSNPHHRISAADDVEATIPGFLVGGPNGGPSDYVDEYGSYTTNEIAINWSSPMTALLAAIDAELGDGAVVESDSFAIVLQINGPGTVEIEPAQRLYEKGTTVQLTAVPVEDEIFRGWNGALASLDETITLTVEEDILLTTQFGLVDEIVRNGSFDDGEEEWSISNNEGGEGTGSVTDGVFEIDITNGGDMDWSIQMVQSGLELVEGGEYSFCFEAWADSARTIIADIAMSNDPWASYTGGAGGEISLSTEPRMFTINFTMTDPTDQEARITFNTGLSDKNVYIDNVSLTMNGMSSISHSVSASAFQNILRAKTVGSRVQVNFMLQNPAASYLKIYSVSGRLIKDLSSQIQKLEKGNQTITIPNHLGTGMYVLRFFDGNRQYTQAVSLIRKS